MTSVPPAKPRQVAAIACDISGDIGIS
jgi:hypothetical protein